MKCRKCQKDMIQTTKNANHTIFSWNVNVLNVPYNVCETCGKEVYENDHKVDTLVRDAYRMKQHTIEY